VLAATELSPSPQMQQCCVQEAEFSAAFIIGISGSGFNEQQNRWVFPVSCQKLHYTPRFLALMLLLALPRLLSKRPNNPAPDDTVFADPMAAPSSSCCVHKATGTAKCCPHQLLVPNCCAQDSCTCAVDCLKATSSLPGGSTACTSGALGEGLENEWKLDTPELPAPPQNPEAQAAAHVKSHGTCTRPEVQHESSIKGLCEAGGALPVGCAVESARTINTSGAGSFAGPETDSAFSPASAHQPVASLDDNACVDQREQGVSVNVGSVWLALTQAQRDLMLEVQRLRTLRQEQMPDPVLLLSCMLRIYAQDVLWSQHMRSVAAAAVALSTSNAQEHQTECSCSEQTHNQSTVSCKAHQQAPIKACRSIMQARGLMHAVGQVIATKSAERMHGTTVHIPGTERGDNQKERQRLVLKEENCNMARTKEAVTRGTSVQVALPIGTPERPPQSDNKNVFIWHKVRSESS
jgi:hypothetical protein